MIVDRVLGALRYAGERDEVLTLALEVEARARRLSGLASADAQEGGHPHEADVVGVLRSTRLLLEPANLPDPVDGPGGRPPADPPAVAGAPSKGAREPDGFDEQVTAHQGTGGEATSRAPGDPEVSAAIDELIAVRDMVILAAAGDARDAPEALAALGRKLGRVLERHGVRVLEDEGEFDWRVQEALDFRPTSDPEQDERVCKTIRPGYAIGQRIIRPQQVMIYRLPEG